MAEAEPEVVATSGGIELSPALGKPEGAGKAFCRNREELGLEVGFP